MAGRIVLITGANQGIGKQVATELSADGDTVFIGSRDLDRGKEAAAEIGGGAVAILLDVTDGASIRAAADQIGQDAGRLDLLVNNAAVSSTRTDVDSFEELRASSVASRVALEEVRAVWEVNVFGPLAVFQAMLPLLRASSDARIVNVTSAMGSLQIMGSAGRSPRPGRAVRHLHHMGWRRPPLVTVVGNGRGRDAPHVRRASPKNSSISSPASRS